jgi:FkbM family methyltransferase
MKSILRKGISYVKRKSNHLLTTPRRSRQGTQSLTIGNTTAKFDAGDRRGGDRVRFRHETERIQLEDLLSNLRENDVLFDIGACVGTHTCFAANHISDGKVVAFEPYPPNAEQLKRNIIYNNGDVAICNVALSDSAGHVAFEIPEDPAVGYGSSAIASSPAETTDCIRTARGDQYITENDLPRPTVVKIDVEGAECLVIEGMKETLASDECRLLYCEIHLPTEDDHRPSAADFGSSLEGIREVLHDLGFTTEVLNRTEIDIHLKASKN